MVIDAIAQTPKVSVLSQPARTHDEDQEVRAVATERAERKGTTVEEEVHHVAEQREKIRKSADRIKADHKAAHTFRYMEIEGDLAAAQGRLMHALKTAQDVGWEQEEIELLTDSIGKIRAVLNLIDLRIAGETQVDWDSELTRLTDTA